MPIRGGLTKRRTVEAELPNGKLKLTAPDQPRSGIIYTGKRKNNDKNVFDFKDDKLGSRIVKNFKTILKPTNEFATEHIIEVIGHYSSQTVLTFSASNHSAIHGICRQTRPSSCWFL